MNYRPDSMLSEQFLKTSDSLFECVVKHTPELRKGQLERLIRSYGPPLTSYLIKSRRLNPDIAEELLQSFLLEKLIEPEPEGNIASLFLKCRKENPNVRFRDYLRRSLRNYLYDLSRKKKFTTINLDAVGDQGADLQLDEIDELEYDVTWANSLLNQACVAVRAECHVKKQTKIWEVFHERMLRPIETGLPAPTYEDLCSTGRFESPKQAANLYMTAIRKFNRVLRDLVGNYLPCEGHSSPEAIDAELLELQKALATPGALHLKEHADFSINDSLNSLKQQLLCIPDDVASLWNDHDLANLWHSLLHGSLTSLLTEVSGKNPEFSSNEVSNWNETLSQLLTRDTPALSVLRTIKDVSKLHASQTAHCLGIDREVEDVFPPAVTMLLYGLSIAVARVRLNERITRDRDEQFVPRACRLLEFTWVDDQSRQVLRDWLERLRT